MRSKFHPIPVDVICRAVSLHDQIVFDGIEQRERTRLSFNSVPLHELLDLQPHGEGFACRSTSTHRRCPTTERSTANFFLTDSSFLAMSDSVGLSSGLGDFTNTAAPASFSNQSPERISDFS